MYNYACAVCSVCAHPKQRRSQTCMIANMTCVCEYKCMIANLICFCEYYSTCYAANRHLHNQHVPIITYTLPRWLKCWRIRYNYASAVCSVCAHPKQRRSQSCMIANMTCVCEYECMVANLIYFCEYYSTCYTANRHLHNQHVAIIPYTLPRWLKYWRIRYNYASAVCSVFAHPQQRRSQTCRLASVICVCEYECMIANLICACAYKCTVLVMRPIDIYTCSMYQSSLTLYPGGSNAVGLSSITPALCAVCARMSNIVDLKHV